MVDVKRRLYHPRCRSTPAVLHPTSVLQAINSLLRARRQLGDRSDDGVQVTPSAAGYTQDGQCPRRCATSNGSKVDASYLLRHGSRPQQCRQTPGSTLGDPLQHLCLRARLPRHAVDFRTGPYHLCSQKGLRHLIVVDADGDLYGVASDTDFMKMLGVDVLSGQERVEQVMSQAPLSIGHQAPLNDAIALMLKFKAPSVVAVDDGRPVGILTERDLVRLSQEGASDNTPLSAIMTSPVLTIAGERSIYYAIEIMRV